jgi:two-component system capsular synthesis sensor histidine kinase RcsC
MKQSRRILIVEDNPLQNAALYQVLFHRWNFDVVQAVDGLEMLEQLDTGTIDLCITDIDLPNLDGARATKIARSLGITIPIMGVSGLDKQDPLLKGCVDLFDAFLPKPLVLETLHQTLLRLTGQGEHIGQGVKEY